MTHLPATLVGLAALAGLAASAGCGGASPDDPDGGGPAAVVAGTPGPRPSGPAAPHDVDRETAVAADAGATPGEVVAAGVPTSVDALADGTLLVRFVARPEVDELPSRYAWRILSPAGDLLAEGLDGRTARAAADAFVLLTPDDPATDVAVLDRSGEETASVPADGRSYPQPGDVLVDEHFLSFVSPQDAVLHRAPRVPGQGPGRRDIVQHAALSEDGTLLTVADWTGRDVTVHATGDRGRTRSAADLVLRDDFPMDLLAGGPTAVLALGSDNQGTDLTLTRLQVTSDGGRTFAEVGPAAGPPLDREHALLDLSVARDGRVLLGDDRSGWWEATDPRGTSYEPLALPPDAVDSVRRVGDRLFAWGPVTPLWVSTDDGAHWQHADVGS